MLTFSKNTALQWNSRFNRAFIYIAFALLAAGIVTVHTLLFESRNYRQDEAFVLEQSIGFSPYQHFLNVATSDVHPPLWFFVSDVWVKMVGDSERTSRFIATLGTLITLAFTFRIAADLFNKQAGLFAVFILGFTNYYEFYSHEYRVYFILCGETVATLLLLLRWIRKPNFGNALLYVLAGVVSLYTHYYALYIIAAEAITFGVLARWNRARYVRAFGLFVAIGVSFLGWILPFLHNLLVTWPGGMWYAVKSNLYLIYVLGLLTQLGPDPLGRALFVLSPLLMIWLLLGKRLNIYTTRTPFRFGDFGAWLYLAVPMLVLLLIPIGTQAFVSNLTTRNLVIVVPLMAVLAAVSLTMLPRLLKWAAVPIILLLIPGLLTLPPYETTDAESGPYREIVAFMNAYRTPDARIIIDSDLVDKQLVYLYFLEDRLKNISGQNIFQITDFSTEPEKDMVKTYYLLPHKPLNIVVNSGAGTLQQAQAFIGNAAQVWYISDQATPFSQDYRALLMVHYRPLHRMTWGDHNAVIEFVRIDDASQPPF